MLWWKVPTVVRAGSLCSGYGIGHLSQCPLLRCAFHAPFSRDYTAHHGRRCPQTSLQSLYSSAPRLPSLGSQPHRSASGTSGPGWYESLTDSTPVHLTEQLLISTHQATGLPWWATIVCTTLALRTAITLPLGAYQMVILSKVRVNVETLTVSQHIVCVVVVTGVKLFTMFILLWVCVCVGYASSHWRCVPRETCMFILCEAGRIWGCVPLPRSCLGEVYPPPTRLLLSSSSSIPPSHCIFLSCWVRASLRSHTHSHTHTHTHTGVLCRQL